MMNNEYTSVITEHFARAKKIMEENGNLFLAKGNLNLALFLLEHCSMDEKISCVMFSLIKELYSEIDEKIAGSRCCSSCGA